MAESDDNLVLRLLREIRAQQSEDGMRLLRVERRLEELHDSVGTALGFAAHANVVAERSGEQFDELRAQIESLRRRVADLEAQGRAGA